MKTKLIKIGTLGLALAAVGCVSPDDDSVESDSLRTRGQAVSVVPEFHIANVDQIPSDLVVTDIGLVVSEIRLVPVQSENGLAYSTANPIGVKFKVNEDELARRGDEIVLPDKGRYIVSIRLEPVATLEGETETSSFSMDGYAAEIPDFANTSKHSDGTPLPLPFDEKPDVEDDEEAAKEAMWTPFQYNSKQTIFYTFNDVELVPGKQVLTFTFDVQQWADSVADPISKAIRNSATAEEEGIDVTREVESVGQGARALIEGGVVQTDQLPPQ